MKKFLLILLVVLILIQFIQPPHNNGSAASATDITHVVPVPDSVMAILQRSCYDCHSNHTVYPWYSKITPVNWWLNNHINGGKRHLNFSEYTTGTFKRKIKRLDEVGETVEKHDMPLDSYLWIHKDAKLSEAQQQVLINWSKASQKLLMDDSLKTVAH
jgi:hypothetical protein